MGLGIPLGWPTENLVTSWEALQNYVTGPDLWNEGFDGKQRRHLLVVVRQVKQQPLKICSIVPVDRCPHQKETAA